MKAGKNLIKIGGCRMKVLKIENSKGFYYSTKTKQYVEIDKIDRDALLEVVEYIMNNNDDEFDAYSDGTIANKAQDIVYKSIYEKLKELKDKKETIINDIDSKYKNAFEEYK